MTLLLFDALPAAFFASAMGGLVPPSGGK